MICTWSRYSQVTCLTPVWLVLATQYTIVCPESGQSENDPQLFQDQYNPSVWSGDDFQI